MKITQILLLGIFITCLVSCVESFNYIEADEFNRKITERTDIKTAEELIILFYNYPKSEGTPKLNCISKELKNNKIQVTLIHNGLEDDSQSAVKIVMIVEKTENKWFVHEIKNNWKCWKDRGHTNWGTKYCN